MIPLIKEILENIPDDPYFIVDYIKLGRGIGNPLNETDPHSPGVTKTKYIACWEIVGDNLIALETNYFGIFFDTRTYLIEWTFEFISADTEVKEKTIFFHLRGCNSGKGISPLPPNYNENTIVERICQWSEPPVFFHIFPRNVAFLRGHSSNFNANISHLFIVRGELLDEIHLYEFQKEKLFSVGKVQQYQSIFALWKKIDFTPRLFYLNSITGTFLATEVEYSLRCADHIATFPVLQSHLYTADQPALFLLDNNTDIWLWKGHSELHSDDVTEQYKLAEKTAEEYAKVKEALIGNPVVISYATAGSEPLEFINIFPIWNS
ncbi:hypothetical protein JTB14_018373 [Gonioctena quinquepunctata]|nr:hypothetical protein JTB14_018373 [Gonioctena quinquepunctata]